MTEQVLHGRIAMVTGASRGIGRAIASELGAMGSHVIVHYGEREAGAEETAAAIREAGGEASVLGADISQPAAISALFGQVDDLLASLGRDKLDILVNNAGIGGGGGVDDVTLDAFDRLVAVNVRGLFLVTQAALPRLRDGGRIINISSMVGLAAYPGSIAYGMTKAAVNSFTVSLAQALGPRGITVNAVAPGATATDFVQAVLDKPELARHYAAKAALNRIGTPEEVAGPVGFLASPKGGWINGQIVQVSGGMHLD
jgi:3-oxoacyl-[acyl-carrier protein] reductase